MFIGNWFRYQVIYKFKNYIIMAKQHHVVPNPNGGWDVRKSGGERASVHTDTKQEAINRGREISQNQKTEFVIHKKDGTIGQKDSHGNDPCPPKDK